MKKFSFLLISMFILASCSNDDDNEIIDPAFLGEWELVRTTGQFEGSERTGEDMEWQESYTLRADGTFTKRRVRDGETTVAEGTYIINDDPQTISAHAIVHLTMVYQTENTIIATCYSDQLKEELYFPSKDLLKNTYHYCDGLELDYIKK